MENEDGNGGASARAGAELRAPLVAGDQAGKLQVTRDERNQRRIPVTEVHRLLLESELHQAADDLAAHIRVRGVVGSVRSHGIETLVELQAGPFEITATVTRATLRRLELVEGEEALVTIRGPAVLIQRAAPG